MKNTTHVQLFADEQRYENPEPDDTLWKYWNIINPILVILIAFLFTASITYPRKYP
jgi:hypothetical protein